MTTLLVASPGGHLEEMLLLAGQLEDAGELQAEDVLWVTSRTPQSTGLLEGRPVHWSRPIGSGDLRAAVLALPDAIRLHRRVRPDRLVTTGAALAVPHLLAATLHRCESWYVESATRTDGPSRTGALAARLPGVLLFTQGAGWGDPRWQQRPSVFDVFESVDAPAPADRIDTAVVAMGTEKFAFPRAVLRCMTLLSGSEVEWQTGTTVIEGTPLQQWLPPDRLRAACQAADVVVIHAGVGSALMALDAGKIPVILPRRRAFGEHVDDHQQQVAALLAHRGLAVVADPDRLSYDDLLRASSRSARRLG